MPASTTDTLGLMADRPPTLRPARPLTSGIAGQLTGAWPGPKGPLLPVTTAPMTERRRSGLSLPLPGHHGLEPGQLQRQVRLRGRTYFQGERSKRLVCLTCSWRNRAAGLIAAVVGVHSAMPPAHSGERDSRRGAVRVAAGEREASVHPPGASIVTIPLGSLARHWPRLLVSCSSAPSSSPSRIAAARACPAAARQEAKACMPSQPSVALFVSWGPTENSSATRATGLVLGGSSTGTSGLTTCWVRRPKNALWQCRRPGDSERPRRRSSPVSRSRAHLVAPDKYREPLGPGGAAQGFGPRRRVRQIDWRKADGSGRRPSTTDRGCSLVGTGLPVTAQHADSASVGINCAQSGGGTQIVPSVFILRGWTFREARRRRQMTPP